MVSFHGIKDLKEVVYDQKRWMTLKRKREKAIRVMEKLQRVGIYSIIHGSVARGDVDEDSDVDIVIPYPIPPYKVELAVSDVVERVIIQATPLSTPKVYLYLDPYKEVVISFPLVKPEPKESEFYNFSGQVDLEGLRRGKRVPGVDKKLILKIPTERGHVETSIIRKEHLVAKILNVSVETVLEREKVLVRRRELGRTGVLIKYVIPHDESVEEAIERLAKRYPYFRELLREKGF